MNNQLTNKHGKNSGGFIQDVKSFISSLIISAFAGLIMLSIMLTSIYFAYVLPAFLTFAIMFTAFVVSIVFLKITSLVMLTILALICLTISYPVFIVLNLMTLSMLDELLGGRYEK